MAYPVGLKTPAQQAQKKSYEKKKELELCANCANPSLNGIYCYEHKVKNHAWRDEYRRRDKISKLLLSSYDSVPKKNRWGPEKHKSNLLKKAYGITTEQVLAILELQEYCCAACWEPILSTGKRRWHVDHDHKTGKVRGITHGVCNTAMGLVKDTPEILRNLADYLERGGIGFELSSRT